jgi:hypothetical protein
VGGEAEDVVAQAHRGLRLGSRRTFRRMQPRIVDGQGHTVGDALE